MLTRCLSFPMAGLLLFGILVPSSDAVAQEETKPPRQEPAGAGGNPFDRSLPIKEFKGNAVPNTNAKARMTELMIGPAKIVDDEEPLQKLIKERYNTSLQEIQARFMEFRSGRSGLDELGDALERLMKSEASLDRDELQRERFLKKMVEIFENVEQSAELNYQHGVRTVQDVYQARYYRLEAQIRLLKFQRDLEKD